MTVPSPAHSGLLSSFAPLSWAETELCSAAVEGRTATALAKPQTPADMTVRAEFLRSLLLERDPGFKLHERGFGLFRMRVAENLDLEGCELRRPLRFIDCVLGPLNLVGAKLATLSFNGGSVESISGDRSVIDALFLRGVEVQAGVRLLGAQITGDLDCTAARLSARQPGATKIGNKAFDALNAALGLDGASIGGAFMLRETWMHGSLKASSLVVGKLADLRKLSMRTGQVNLDSATLGGDLDLSGATIRSEPGFAPSQEDTALRLSLARIAGSLQLTSRFETDGGVDLNDLRVGGNLTLRGARFTGRREFALLAQRMQVQGAFDLDSSTCFGPEATSKADASGTSGTGRLAPRPEPGTATSQPEPGSAVDLTAASVGSLSDQWASWPKGNRVLGFRYKQIAGATSTRAAWWVDWLRLQVAEDLGPVGQGGRVLGTEGFKPQPWNQAMVALREVGCVRDAEDLAIAKEDAEHAFDTGARKFWFHLWGRWAGYGYRPLRLLWALPGVYVLSVVIYAWAAWEGAMAPTKEEFLAKPEYQHCKPEYGGNWARCPLAPAYPDFFALAYAAQMLLPAIELRQSKDWAPVPWQRPVHALPPAQAASQVASAPGLAVSAKPTPPASASTTPIAAGASAPLAASSAAPAVATTVSSTVAEPDDKASLSVVGVVTLIWSWIESTLGLAAPVLVGLALSGLIRRKTKD
ncbi:MAG: hypothetical protein ABIR54_18975 [Burkholderiaceae bacterium]